MDIYDQYLRNLYEQQRGVEASFMAGGGLGSSYQQQQYAPGMIMGMQGMQNAYVSTYKPKKKTQAMKRYEKLLRKRDLHRLHKRLFISLLLITTPISYYYFEDGLLIEGAIIGVIVGIWALVEWAGRND